jgi:pilus assembly protein CpaB
MKVVTSTRQTVAFVSLFFSLAVGFLTFNYLNHIRWQNNRVYYKQLSALSSLTKVVVLRRSVPAGAVLSKDDLKLALVPKTFVNNYTARSLKKVVGARVKVPLFKNEPLSRLRLKFSHLPAASQLVKKGKLALAIPADAVLSLAGGVKPYDHVAVFFTNDDNGKTEVLADDVFVLGVSGEEPFKKDRFNEQPVIVLEVTPKQAAQIVQASYQGKLQLGLRSRGYEPTD